MTAIIENWSFSSITTSPYQPPEMGIPRFRGEVFNHPEKEDGKTIMTSEVKGYDPATDEFICSSRRYKLGKVSPAYEILFPNAKERLIKAFSKSVSP